MDLIASRKEMQAEIERLRDAIEEATVKKTALVSAWGAHLASDRTLCDLIEAEPSERPEIKRLVDEMIAKYTVEVDELTPRLEEATEKLKTMMDVLRQVIQEFENEEHFANCPICYVNKIAIASTPCGHTLCETCQDRLIQKQKGRKKVCPVCRGDVKGTVKIYF